MHAMFGVAFLVGAIAAGDPPPAPQPEPRPELSLSIESVGFNVRQDFAAAAADPRLSTFGATQIIPRFVVRSRSGFPLVSVRPRSRIARLTAADGTDLLAAGATLGPPDGDFAKGAPRFVACGAERSGRSAQSPAPLHPQTPTILLDRIPDGLGVLEGELVFDVVEEDNTREFALGAAPKNFELAPGVHLLADAAGPTPQVSLTVDPPLAPGSTPILNFVRFTAGPESTGLGITLIEDAPPADAPTVARAKLLAATEGRTVYVQAHTVLKSRPVSLPFRLENISFGPLAHDAYVAPPSSRDFTVAQDGLTLRLLALSARGAWSMEPSARTQGPGVALGLRLEAAPGGHALGWVTTCQVDSATSESGATIYQAPRRADGERADPFFERTYVPCPALPTKDDAKFPYADKGRTLIARFPLSKFPPRFGVIRGTIECAEATREVVREIALTPTPDPIEIAPNVRIIVRDRMPDAHAVPFQPNGEAVVVQIDLPRDAPSKSDEVQAPRLNMVQFIDAAGVAGAPFTNTPMFRKGDRLEYQIGYLHNIDNPVSMRVHIVLEATTHRIPFEFHNVPCTDQ